MDKEIVGWLGRMTRALESIDKRLEYIGNRLEEIRREIVRPTKVIG